MWKKIEVNLIVVAVIVALSWIGFEIWVRNFADGSKLNSKSVQYYDNKEYFKGQFLAKLAIKAGHEDTKIMLCEICLNEKRPHDALYWIQQYKGRHQYLRDIFYLRVYEALKQYDNALDYFSKMKFKEKFVYYSYIKSRIKKRMYNPTKTLKDYQKMASNGNKKVYSYLGSLLLANNNNENGVNYFEKAIANNDIWSVLMLGNHFFKLKDYKQAMIYYQKASALGYKKAPFYIINVYRKQGLNKKALECYKTLPKMMRSETKINTIKWIMEGFKA